MLKNNDGFIRYDYRSACTFYLFAIVTMLVVQALGAGIGAGLQLVFPDVNITKNGDFNGAFMIFAQVASCVFIFVYTRCARKKFDFTIVRRADGGANVALLVVFALLTAAVLMIGMYLPTTWYGLLMRVIGIPEDFGALEMETVTSVIMTVIATVFLAPVFEELIYRGVLLHGLKRQKRAVVAVLLSAFAFMLMHMNPLQVVFQFALGAVAAIIVLKTGRVLPAMVMHAASNALALVISETAIASSLSACIEWLMANPAAAVFITLGIAAAAGALIFVIIRFGFGKAVRIESSAADETPEYADEKERMTAEALAKHNVSTGNVMYWVGAGLCIGMLVMNLIAAII